MMRTRKSSSRRRDLSSFSVYNLGMQGATLISAQEFDLLAETDERRLEFMDGEVIELSFAAPIHSVVVRSLFLQLEHVAS